MAGHLRLPRLGKSFSRANGRSRERDNSSVGERRRWLATAEASAPLLSGWELSLAGRRDAYDDVGDAFSWRLASRYRLNDALAVRAAWDRGSRPPSLYSMHLRNAPYHPYVCDPAPCTQVTGAIDGNPELKPDKATRTAVGATASLGAFSLGATGSGSNSPTRPK